MIIYDADSVNLLYLQPGELAFIYNSVSPPVNMIPFTLSRIKSSSAWLDYQDIGITLNKLKTTCTIAPALSI